MFPWDWAPSWPHNYVGAYSRNGPFCHYVHLAKNEFKVGAYVSHDVMVLATGLKFIHMVSWGQKDFGGFHSNGIFI